MAPRLAHSDNIVFLFKCIESTNTKIDFSKVGSVIGLNANAARMRYVRLRKAVESDLASNVPLQLLASSSGHLGASSASISKKTSLARKRKIAPDEDDDDDAYYNSEQNAVRFKKEDLRPPTKRQTRGVKLDFTEADADSDNSGRITNGGDSSSDFKDEPDTTDEEMTDHTSNEALATPKRPVKIVRLKIKNAESNRLAFDSPSIGLDHRIQDVSTPIKRVDQQASLATARLTPPETPTKQRVQMHTAASPDSLTPSTSDLDLDLSTLQNGKKIPSAVFKQEPVRQNLQRSAAHKPLTKPSRQPLSLSRVLVTPCDDASGTPRSNVNVEPAYPPVNSPREQIHDSHHIVGRRNASAAVKDSTDSLAPDDSVSMVGEKRSYSPMVQDDIVGNKSPTGPTFMQRISSFWK